jgi:hypothetical protein
MPQFKYKPYYYYNGPTLAEPFREKRSDDEVSRNMSRFFDEIGHHFSDVGAVIEPVEDGVIGITADVTQEECDSRVKRCLNSLDLYAFKIRAK